MVDKRITKLSIVNAKTGEVCYTWSKSAAAKKSAAKTTKATATKASCLSEATKTAIKEAVNSLSKAKGYKMENILASLAKPENVGKPTTEYTEADAEKALSILQTWALN